MKSPAVQLSTYPFADGFAWDEELIRSRHRAVSTHGLSNHQPLGPLRLAADRAARLAALEITAARA